MSIRVESSVSRLLDKHENTAGLLAVIRDVTAESEAAEALRESEERYRMLFNSIDEGFCIIEILFDSIGQPADYRFLQINPAFEIQTGLTDALGRTLLEMVPDHEPFWLDLYAQVASTGEPLRYQNYDRELRRHFDLYACRFGAPDKHQVAVVFDDVTERIKAEETLRQNEALFSKIIDQAPGGVYVVDSEFRVMEVNSLARPTFSAVEPLIGRDFNEVMSILWGPEVGPRLSAIFRHTLETGEKYVSPRFTERRDDIGAEKSYDWETRRLTLPDGKHGVVCYFSDVTEQQQLEDALRNSEQRANNIVQSITDGFITLDRDWRITYLSTRGAEILAPLKKTSTNVLGKIFWEEFPPTVGTEIERNYRQAMESQVPVLFETHYLPLDRWFDLRVYPSPSGLSLFFLDITERKQAEAALQESRRILAEQASALRSADRNKDEFLAMLAHELRNPLAPLRNATEILQSPAAGAAEHEQARQLISRQIGNMSRMIDDLLDVSRITEGKIELRRQRVALDTILHAAAEMLRPACEAHGQQLVVTLPSQPLFVDADTTRLEQVFGNLIGNACKYSGNGSHIAVVVDTPTAGTVAISIADDGIGIDAELLPRIFDLFVQSSRTLDRSHGGLGIGLTIVHRLVNLHGGSIEAHSGGPGHGAEFIVKLPLLGEELERPSEATAKIRTERALRILIVDDNRDSADTMAMLQQLRGHETRTAYTGPEAVSIAAEFTPEVVLLDIGLPGMDGFEVARRLREMPALRNAFLVALTGYGTADDQEKSKSAGFDEHLPKPADLQRLREWFTDLA